METKEIKAGTRTGQILVVVQVLAWIAFIGLMIKTGAILFSFCVTLFNPEGEKNVYSGLDLSELRQYNLWYYAQHVSLLVAVPALKAYLMYLVVQMLSKVNLANPFTAEMALLLEKTSYVLFSAWLLGILSQAHAKWLQKVTGTWYGSEVFGEWFLVAGLVFIISQIFRKGVEMQAERELTI